MKPLQFLLALRKVRDSKVITDDEKTARILILVHENLDEAIQQMRNEK